MKKVILFFFFTIFVSGVILSCQTKDDSSISRGQEKKLTMEEIKKYIETGQALEKENPFNLRQFKPYMDGKWIGNAISYGCYREGQAPGAKGPDSDEILEDLNILKEHWNLIRTYGADDDAERVLKVIRKNKLPFKVMMGIWLENETKHPERKPENIAQVVKGIELANEYSDIIAAVNVGNESQVFWSWHRMNTANLIQYIRAVRKYTSLPITTADDYNFWNKPEGMEVAKEIDFIVTHIYPLWNGKTLDNAIHWMDSTYRDLEKRYPEMQLVLGETGWATTYNADKTGPGEQGRLIKDEVSVKAQERYLLAHNKWVNNNKVTTFLFEAFDEPWKGGGESSGANEIEKNWGVYYSNRTPKASFQNYLKTINKNGGMD